MAVRTKQATGRDGLRIGERILLVRKRRGMNQVQLSKATGIPRRTLTRYENGESDVPSVAVELIAAALRVSPNELHGYSGVLVTPE
jgi:transcriptional regulator with XRE-family HTH domain